MFEVGFTEIVLILGLALLVLGPEKLPGLAEKVGRWTGRARSMARQLRTQLEQEVTLEEMSKSKPMQAPRQDPEPMTPEHGTSQYAAAHETNAATEAAAPSEPVHQEFDLDSFATADPPEPAPAADKVASQVTQ